MSKLKLELTKKTVLQKLAMGANHITAMDGNANYPEATRVPTDAQFQLVQDNLQQTSDAAAAAESSYKAAINARDSAEAEWDLKMTARAGNCEAVTPNDLVALSTTGLPLRTTPGPIGPMPPPSNLRASMSEMEGQINLAWDTVHGASSYIVDCKEHDTPQPWQQVKVVKQSHCTSTDHTPGKVYAFRVRALGTDGEGPWSDETVKMSP